MRRTGKASARPSTGTTVTAGGSRTKRLMAPDYACARTKGSRASGSAGRRRRRRRARRGGAGRPAKLADEVAQGELGGVDGREVRHLLVARLRRNALALDAFATGVGRRLVG